MTLAAKVKDFRLMHPKMTHEEAMDELGISNGTYYKILRGEQVSDRIRAAVEHVLDKKQVAA